jgi:hypothetical protein
MRRFFPLITICVVLSVVIQARDVYYQGDLAPRNILPTFDKGYLAVYEQEHTVSLYGPDGSRAYKAKAQVPGETWTNVENAAPDADGSLAIAVEYRVEKSQRRGGIALFDPSGTQVAFIDTGADWLPTQVCFGPDHSIWAMGWRGIAPAATNTDYSVLRNYDRDGRLLNAFLPRSFFDQDPVGPIVGGWQLRSANGRIGGLFYVTSVLALGTERRKGEWIETDVRGNVVRRVDIPEKTIRAFSSDGALYAQGYRGGYTVLSPAVNSWRTVSGVSDGGLLGADGSSLVFLIRGTNRVVWSPLE